MIGSIRSGVFRWSGLSRRVSARGRAEKEQPVFCYYDHFRHGPDKGRIAATKGKITMKHKLSAKEYTYVASMLFGLFFGAGNLIFPVHLGQMAGSNAWQAILGLLITAVGLPLLGVAALGISRSTGLFDLSSKVNRPYAMFFTCALYLTIGPFFAIPRCATTSFTVGLEQILPQDGNTTLYLLLFSVAFFAAALFFALRPGKILTWVGKILTPCFLVFLAILVIVVLVTPSVSIADVEPLGD